jgi:hypothetical protein
MSIFKTKCDYYSKCGAFRDNSITCTKEIDKNFCGIYKQFEQNKIVMYITNVNVIGFSSRECTQKVKCLKK